MLAVGAEQLLDHLEGDLLANLLELRGVREFYTAFVEVQDVLKRIEFHWRHVEDGVERREDSLRHGFECIPEEVRHLKVPELLVAGDVDV